MGILVTVTLVRPTFHGLTRGKSVQWPPDPVRLLGALKSGAHALEGTALAALAHEVLDHIAVAPPPVISTPLHIPLEHPATYTDRTGLPDRVIASGHDEKDTRFLTLAPFAMDSMNRTAKVRDGMALAGLIITFAIDLDLTADELRALDAAAQQIPYFGRSEDAAVVEVLPQHPAAKHPDDTTVTWHPSFDPDGTSRGWQANTIEWMNENHARVFSDDPAVSILPALPPTGYVRPLTYRTGGTPHEQPRLAVVRLPSPRPQHQAPALMRRMQAQLPAGYGLLPLTVSSHPLSDGRLVGLGIFADQEAEADPAAVALRLRDDLGLPADNGRPLEALKPETWTGPARRWTSTTPLRGFPQLLILETALKHEAQQRFGHDITVTEASTHIRTPREHRWANSGYIDGLGLWWITIEFAEPITGPMQLGASTDHGFGTFGPQTDQERA